MSIRDWFSYCMCVWLTHMNRTPKWVTSVKPWTTLFPFYLPVKVVWLYLHTCIWTDSRFQVSQGFNRRLKSKANAPKVMCTKIQTKSPHAKELAHGTWHILPLYKSKECLLTNWLMLGCSHPVVMALIVAMASRPPAAPRQCPIIDWKIQPCEKGKKEQWDSFSSNKK